MRHCSLENKEQENSTSGTEITMIDAWSRTAEQAALFSNAAVFGVLTHHNVDLLSGAGTKTQLYSSIYGQTSVALQ